MNSEQPVLRVAGSQSVLEAEKGVADERKRVLLKGEAHPRQRNRPRGREESVALPRAPAGRALVREGCCWAELRVRSGAQ